MLKIETENKKLIWKLPEKESDQLFTHLSLQLIELTGGVAKCAAERTENIPDLVPTREKEGYSLVDVTYQAIRNDS